MRTYIIPTLLLCVFFMNCKTQNYEDKYSYKNIIIPDSLFKFYPQNLDNLTRDIYFSSASKEENSIIPYYKYTCFAYFKSFKIENMKIFNSEIQIISQNFIDSIDILNDNYSIIGDHLYIEKRLGDSLNNCNYKNFNINKLLFSFNYIISESSVHETKCGLNKTYKMYILMKGLEFILPQKYYTENTYLPEGFRHGYLSGIAYSIEEQKIIYWTCAW